MAAVAAHRIMMALRILLETVEVVGEHQEAPKVLTVAAAVAVDMVVAERELELLAKAITVLLVFGHGIPVVVVAPVLLGPLIQLMEAGALKMIS